MAPKRILPPKGRSNAKNPVALIKVVLGKKSSRLPPTRKPPEILSPWFYPPESQHRQQLLHLHNLPSEELLFFIHRCLSDSFPPTRRYNIATSYLIALGVIFQEYSSHLIQQLEPVERNRSSDHAHLIQQLEPVERNHSSDHVPGST